MSVTDPVAELVRFSRTALGAAGLSRQEHDGSVYWNGGKGGETLVLLHGTNDQAGSWARVVPLLITRYKLIVPDLAGHGESEPRSGPIPFARVLENLHHVLAKETTEKVILAGNSFGAWIALLYALAHPERVKRLVLEAGGGLARPLGVPLIATDRATAMTILRAVHGPAYIPQEWVIDALLGRATDAPMLRLADPMQNFVDGRLGEIELPVSLVWGADDGVVPLSYAEELKKLIAGSKLHVIDGAAHIPHLQQPEKFVACLMATS